jgi:nitrate/nitrite transporter NarK
VRKQAEHRIRGAARLAARGWGWIGVAALAMNAPSLAATAFIAWIALNTDQPAVATIAWILFAIALVWSVMVTVDAWRVLRRFARRVR